MTERLHTGFLKAVQQYPDKIAFVQGENRFTYQALYHRAKIIANFVSKLCTDEETLIGVLLQKGWEQIATTLGILMAGVVYVPLDVNAPKSRNLEIIKQSHLKLLITDSEFFSIDECSKIEVAFFDETILSNEEEKLDFQIQNLQNLQNPHSLAYIIFTSGSTGRPKGVAIQHFAVMNTLCDMINRFSLTKSDVILGLSELNFDLSVFDIFGIFSVGGKLVLPTAAENRDPKKWFELIQREKVSIWNTVPAFLSMFYEFNQDKQFPSVLRLFLLSGDWIPIPLIKKMKALLPNSIYVSLGGATEVSIWSILYAIQEIDPKWNSIPYGRAMRHQTVEILDDSLMPCPVGVIGEIFIGGMGLAREYWKDLEKTQQSFIFDKNHRRLYKTGDFGRLLPNQEIEFLGRRDFQVKLNGYRIELGEIESFLYQFPGVTQAVVLVKNGIYAFITPAHLKEEAIFHDLKLHLPDYMMPKAIFTLEAYPLTLNGKIDFSALLNLIAQEQSKKIIKEPKNSIEKMILNLWKDLFKEDVFISTEDDFFEIGGDSLKAVSVMYQINKIFNQSYPLALIFECRTIDLLAVKIASEAQFNGLIKLNQSDCPLTLFLFHPVSGEVFCYYPLSKKLNQTLSIFAIEADFTDAHSLQELAKKYCQFIENSEVKPPYLLAGWSLGGLIAFEVAKQLGQEKVSYLGLIDTYPQFYLIFQKKMMINQVGLVETIYHYYLKEAAKLMQIEPLSVDFKQLLRFQPKEALEILKKKMLNKNSRHSAEAIDLLNHFTEQFKTMILFMVNYQSKNPLEISANFFKSEEMTQDVADLWILLFKKLNFFDLQGGHLEILEEPYVAHLSQKLLSSILENV